MSEQKRPALQRTHHHSFGWSGRTRVGAALRIGSSLMTKQKDRHKGRSLIMESHARQTGSGNDPYPFVGDERRLHERAIKLSSNIAVVSEPNT